MSLPSSNAPISQPGRGAGDSGVNAASPALDHAHPEHVPASGHGQFALLGQRRFAPFFWVQFLGAGNDNLFKFAFTVLVTYQTGAASGLDPKLVVNLIAALFILWGTFGPGNRGPSEQEIADEMRKMRGQP